MKVLIVGGVAGGATAAARLRRLDEQAEIIILERTGFVSYANCGLPYYVGNVITEREALTLQTPESFRDRFAIDVRVHQEVTKIDPAQKTVTIKRLTDGSQYTETYDKLILSPGAKAVKPDVPGVESDKIFTLRTVEDTYRMQEYVKEHRPKRAVVIGGGFIGLETAENLMHVGVQVTLLQRSKQVMPPYDEDMAALLHSYLRMVGLDLRLNHPFTGFREENGQILTLLKDKEPVAADMVVLAIGVEPDTHLAKEAGLTLGQKGAIVVNEKMETSLPDIYAVGDAVEVTQFVTGQKTLISLAGPANKQGRIVADVICGRDSHFTGSQGSSVIKLFDLTAATTGINEKTAKSLGLSYDKVVNYSASHATYYPGANNMTIKTIFEPETGRILGAQIIGFDGVDKRLDVMASAIGFGATAADLEELDLSYAPPFSSAKDPVNMAGFTIENIRKGLVKQHHWHDVASLPKDGSVTLLDVRTKEEFAENHIPGAINIPLDELRLHLDELEKKPLHVNCYSGLRSYLACRILSQHGFDCSNLSGGFRFYAFNTANQAFDPAPTYPCGVKL